MKPLLWILLGLVAAGPARADYFEKSPTARLDLQFIEGAPPIYLIRIGRGVAELPVLVSGELEKVAPGKYRAASTEGEPPSAALLFAKTGEAWQLAYEKAGKGSPPADAEQIEGTYSPVSMKTAAAHAKSRFAELDTLLNENYQGARQGLSADRMKELRELQREWIGYRDALAQAQPGQVGEEGPVDEAPSYWDTMADLTGERLTFLKAWGGQVATPGIAGEYRDFFGGQMTLTERKGGFDFDIQVVRGPTAHIGEMSGRAELNAARTRAVYQDDQMPPAKLRWTFRADGSVEVSEEHTDEYRGARAYFSGRYYKITGAGPKAE